MNFWFTGCKPCVAELSKLNELNDAIKSMGSESCRHKQQKPTTEIRMRSKKQQRFLKARVRNTAIFPLTLLPLQESMLPDIMAFPTTILVDRNGNIVGEPMLGGIDNQENYDTLMKQIQSVIDADSAK